MTKTGITPPSMLSRAALAAAVIVAGWAMPAAAHAQRDDEDYASRIDTTMAFDRRGTVSLSVGSGEIIVRAWDRDQIRVRARSERGVIRMDALSTRLSLELSRPRGGDTQFDLTVPAGARVSARATNGDISISGVKGGVDAQTQNGDVTLNDVGEVVELRTLSGDILVRGATGPVEAYAVSGDVELSDVRGDLDVTSVSGDIDMRRVIARFVSARSTSGEVMFDGTVDSTGRYELSSHSGSVYLTLPQDVGALLTVATYTGSIESDFPITLKPGSHGVGSTKRFTFEVGRGAGNARVSAESFSGDITIRSRAGSPTSP